MSNMNTSTTTLMPFFEIDASGGLNMKGIRNCKRINTFGYHACSMYRAKFHVNFATVIISHF